MTVTNPVVIADVTSRSFRTLEAEEVAGATTLLDDAWYMLLGTAIGQQVLDQYDPGPVPAAFDHNVRRILANAIIRVVNNPMGNIEEEGDDFRARRDITVSSGRLYLLDSEVAELFPSGLGSAFTIDTRSSLLDRAPLPENAFWDPQE